MASRRKEITDFIIANLKKINSGLSSFNSNYTYLTNLSSNVFRGLKFIDEINDFPAIYMQAGEEERFYETEGFTTASLDILMYLYIKDENSQHRIEDLSQDVEHVIYNLPDNPELGIADIVIDSMLSDEGLMAPFAIGELKISVFYQIE
jgi:hypothetical protein